jgi:hypothetical protein
MATHRVHPDIASHGLADDCERCDQLAGRPWELDDSNLRAAWWNMLGVEFSYPAKLTYRSKTEALLGGRLYDMAVMLERLGVNPRTVIRR